MGSSNYPFLTAMDLTRRLDIIVEPPLPEAIAIAAIRDRASVARYANHLDRLRAWNHRDRDERSESSIGEFCDVDECLAHYLDVDVRAITPRMHELIWNFTPARSRILPFISRARALDETCHA